MTLILKSLGAALITAGLMSTAQAAAAVIDFDEPGIALDAEITKQYAQYGLEFTGPNAVVCSSKSPAPKDPLCTAPRDLPAPPQANSPNFLVNSVGGTGFSINVLSGFSLSRLTLDLAANGTSFFVNFYDASGGVTHALSWDRGSSFLWQTETLNNVNAAVRRIEFGGSDSTSFAIDHLSFDYVQDSTNVPEPAVLGLVALALAGVGLTRRRKG